MIKPRTIRMFLLFISLTISLIACSGQREAEPILVLRGATIIDCTGAPAQPDMTVVIKGNRITELGKTDKVKIPKDAQIVDVTGKFLIPGLWDMHVHIFNNVSAPGTNHKDDYFPLFLANGVTGVRDMFTDVEDIKLVREWKSELEAGQLLAPRIAPGSSIIDGVPVFHKNSVGVSNAGEARKVVRTFKEAGAGFIKIYGYFGPAAAIFGTGGRFGSSGGWRGRDLARLRWVRTRAPHRLRGQVREHPCPLIDLRACC